MWIGGNQRGGGGHKKRHGLDIGTGRAQVDSYGKRCHENEVELKTRKNGT